MDTALLQCTQPHLLRIQRLLCDARKHSPASIVSRSGSGGLFLVPPREDSPQRTPPLDCSRGESGLNELLEERSRKIFVGRLPSVDNILAKVCHRKSILFLRILINCSNIFNTYFFQNLVLLLFIQILQVNFSDFYKDLIYTKNISYNLFFNSFFKIFFRIFFLTLSGLYFYLKYCYV